MTDNDPEIQSQVQNKKPNRFGFVFRKGGRKPSSRPLKMDKWLDGEWREIASFPLPQCKMDEIYPPRLAGVIGGSVRLRIGLRTIEKWEDGIVVGGQLRCA